MSNKKISQLGLAADVTVNDLFQVVDKEDTSMSPSGTNKRITAQTLGNFLPVTATGSSASRSLKDRFADTVNVKDFGAVGDGVTDDTAAFNAACLAAPAANNITGIEGTAVPRALICNITVPSGSYVLSSMIDTYGKEVVWNLAQAAILSNPSYINGKIHRAGQRQTDYHHGTTDFACGLSIRNNGADDNIAEVLGITDPSQLAVYTDRDTVGLYVDNGSPGASLASTTGSYTATSVTTSTVPSADALKTFRRGMIIDTRHSPKWSGVLTSWNANGTQLNVTNWYRVGEALGVASTPTSGTGFDLNAFTKVWAHNANVYLNSWGHATQACGFELGSFNEKGDPVTEGSDPKVWGYDSVNLGTYKCESAFIARGSFFKGFEAVNQDVSFASSGGGMILRSVNALGQMTFQVNNLGGIEMGNLSTSNTPNIDFHSSGVVQDYDARIIAYGGGVGNGKGLLEIISSRTKIWGQLELSTGIFIVSGSGSPEGVVTASVGSLYTNTAGSTSTTLYVKTSGTGNTGWTAK